MHGAVFISNTSYSKKKQFHDPQNPDSRPVRRRRPRPAPPARRDRLLPTISQEDLVKTIGEFDALIVRSRAKVTADVIKAGRQPGRLRVVGRAGVGVDNIDVNAATAAGVIVVNAPTGNVVAAAEHAIAMLLALARRIPEADRSVHAGEWKRNKFVGTEVRNKRLGLVGLGRIASLVADRAHGLGMEVVAVDPYVGTEYAENLGVALTTSTPCSRPPISSRSTCRPLSKPRECWAETSFSAVNPAFASSTAPAGASSTRPPWRGLGSGQAGAALDVFENEPPTSSPLLGQANVVLTPHIAGQTLESQRQVAVDASEQVLAVLQGQLARYAINTPIIPPKDLEFLTPYIDLAERLGHFLTQFEPGCWITWS